jgi:formylglycine-generating enzyme required for sulfatase activity
MALFKGWNLMKRVSGGLVFLAGLGMMLLACAPVDSVPSEPEPGMLSPGPLTGMTFAWIPSGSFIMGSPESESDRDIVDEDQHWVTVGSFEMMTTEVTQGMWEEVMGSNPSYLTGDANRPVEQVSWDDCQDFIEELNDLIRATHTVSPRRRSGSTRAVRGPRRPTTGVIP